MAGYGHYQPTQAVQLWYSNQETGTVTASQETPVEHYTFTAPGLHYFRFDTDLGKWSDSDKRILPNTLDIGSISIMLIWFKYNVSAYNNWEEKFEKAMLEKGWRATVNPTVVEGVVFKVFATKTVGILADELVAAMESTLNKMVADKELPKDEKWAIFEQKSPIPPLASAAP
jgi:hypothetical protein